MDRVQTQKRQIQEIEKGEIQALFEAQQHAAPYIGQSGYRERKAKLKLIQDWLENNLDRLQYIIEKDYRKSPTEFLVSEAFIVQQELKYTIKQLKSWIKPHRVGTPLVMLGTRSHYFHEPKGVCLIISPWNYPFSLTIKPLISCIAAGNTAIVKPSELTPHASGIIKEMVTELFEPEEVTVVEGGVEVSQHLLALPFNHIFFTGSTEVGKIVMEAAAKHLASVTLELGGKSPTIVDASANIRLAGERIAWGKWLNNGQTCIAPDYVLAHQAIADDLVTAIEQATQKMYDPDRKGIQQSPDYDRIVNEKHFYRLQGLLNQAKQAGATVAMGGTTDVEERFIAPTVLMGVDTEMDIMQEEIFGPILPIITYEDQEEALNIIRQLPKPLALYLFTKDPKIRAYFLRNSSAGGTVINETLIHYGQPALPFGGVNHSGFGKSGGKFGFAEFSNLRGVMTQRYGTIKPFYPPYTDRVKKLISWVIKWL